MTAIYGKRKATDATDTTDAIDTTDDRTEVASAVADHDVPDWDRDWDGKSQAPTEVQDDLE